MKGKERKRKEKKGKGGNGHPKLSSIDRFLKAGS